MISENYRNRLIGLLDGEIVKADDFNLIQKGTTGYQLRIVYRYDESINFIVEITQSGDPHKVSFSPGNILSVETKRLGKEDTVEEYVRLWILNIGLKMAALPVIRRIQEQDEKLNEIKDMVQSYSDDSSFNSDEIEELKSKLNNLQEQFEEKVKRDTEKDYDKEFAIAEMKIDIERLKAESNILTKKNWLLSFYTKLHIFTQKNPKLAALIGGIAYQSLPEGIKNNIPEGSVPMLMNSEDIGEGAE